MTCPPPGPSILQHSAGHTTHLRGIASAPSTSLVMSSSPGKVKRATSIPHVPQTSASARSAFDPVQRHTRSRSQCWHVACSCQRAEGQCTTGVQQATARALAPCQAAGDCGRTHRCDVNACNLRANLNTAAHCLEVHDRAVWRWSTFQRCKRSGGLNTCGMQVRSAIGTFNGSLAKFNVQHSTIACCHYGLHLH